MRAPLVFGRRTYKICANMQPGKKYLVVDAQNLILLSTASYWSVHFNIRQFLRIKKVKIALRVGTLSLRLLIGKWFVNNIIETAKKSKASKHWESRIPSSVRPEYLMLERSFCNSFLASALLFVFTGTLIEFLEGGARGRQNRRWFPGVHYRTSRIR